MARSATETARILTELYDERFDGDECERFRINWPELREIAGVKRLTPDFLEEVNDALNESGYLLIRCDNFILVAGETDFANDRRIPQRLVERYRYVPEEPEDMRIDDDDDVIDDEEE